MIIARTKIWRLAMNQIDLICYAKQQATAQYNEFMALLTDIEQGATDERNQFFGIREENFRLKQRANHDDADCRSFADTENNDDS